MPGPGEYVPDATEGITRVEDLPKPRIQKRSGNFTARPCPECHHPAGRYGIGTRTLHDLGDTRLGRPTDLVVTFSRHRCRPCGCHFTADLADIARPECLYTRRVQQLADEQDAPHSLAEFNERLMPAITVGVIDSASAAGLALDVREWLRVHTVEVVQPSEHQCNSRQPVRP